MPDTTATSELVGAYLARLDAQLQDVPRARRTEVVGDIREHIAAALAAEGEPAGEAAVRNVLERLGEPDEIADELRRRFGLPRPSVGARDWAAPLLLSVGSLMLFVVGWIAGAVLLWTSSAFRRWEKVLGTLVWPGGAWVPMFVAMWASGRTCEPTGRLTRGPNGVGGSTCESSGPTWVFTGTGRLIVLVAPLAVAAYLLFRLARVRRALRD